MDFENLFNKFQENYYSEFILLIVEITALIIAITYARTYKTGKLFIIYIAFDLSIFLIDLYIMNNSEISIKFTSLFLRTTNTLIALIELLVYYYFFSKVIKSTRLKKVLIIISILYSLIVCSFLFINFISITARLPYIAKVIGALEFCLLLLVCIFYFIWLLQNVSSEPLLNRPSFWIMSGIFFYSIFSIPYYLISNYLFLNRIANQNILVALFYYLPFSINFIFLSKSFLCKKPLTI